MNISQAGDRWRVIVQHNGHRRSGYARTKRDAEVVGARLLVDLGATPKTSRMTIGELLAHWQVAADISITYRADIESIIGRLPEKVTDMPVTGTGPVAIKRMFADLTAQGWTAHRLRRLHSVLSSAWKMALGEEWVTTNPLAAVTKPPVDRPDVGPPELAVLHELVASTRPALGLYLRVAAAVGARRGEVVGLQWGDLNGAQLNIRRALSTSSTAGTVVTEGKSGRKGQRVVAITDLLAKQLRDHHTAQCAAAVEAGLPDPVWIFSHDQGQTPWRPGYISLEFRRLCKRADVTGVRLHDLRHLMATGMLAAGVPIHIVSGRLGHTKIATTLDVYGHYIPAADAAAASAWEDALWLGS